MAMVESWATLLVVAALVLLTKASEFVLALLIVPQETTPKVEAIAEKMIARDAVFIKRET